MSNPAHIMTDPVAQNLRRLMNLNNVTEAEVSRQTHIPQPTIHKILNGKTADPRASTLRALADFFKISIDELLTGIETKRQASLTHSIPIISWSECINAQEFIETLSPSKWHKWVVTEPLSEACFAVISKPSMAPRFPIGTALVIDPTLQPEDGDIVLVHYLNTFETTLREISIDGPSALLSNLYGNSPPEPITSDISIKGILIRSIFSYHK
jgi:SOS-response transcriptional repressor LexA